jgi:hypothetical protein
MTNNDVIFQQVTNKDGDMEFRLKFGGIKSLVYRRHSQYFHLDLYDNKPGRYKFKGIAHGLDEIDFFYFNQKQLGLASKLLPTTSMYNCFINQSSLVMF